MVESTCFQHTSSHPDKYNNSANIIISKEEEREDPRRDTSVFFEYSGVSTYNPRTTVFPHAIQQLQDNSTYRINSTTRNTTTTRLIPCHPMQIITRHLPVTVSRASKHSTRQNKAPGYPTAFQAHTAQAGFQLILPGRNSIHAAPTVAPRHIPGAFLQNSTRRNRIHFKRVKYCISMQY